MIRLLGIAVTVVLAACSTYPNYRSLASQVVPTNVELVATITEPFSGEIRDKTYCSGVAVSKSHIITAGHCTKAAHEFDDPKGSLKQLLWDGKIKVKLQDGRVVLAKIIWEGFQDMGTADEARDTALLETDEPILTPAKLGDSDTLVQGDQVAIVGNSFGDLKFSFTIGVVSYMNREMEHIGYFIQTDALSAGGNSGGPVFDMDGRLIGILVRGGGGISLALPINDVLMHIHHGLKGIK